MLIALNSESDTASELSAPVRKQTIGLYTQILEYQIRLCKQISRSGFLQYMRDVVTADDSIRNLPQTLSEKAVGEIDCKVDSMSKKVDDSLALALEIKDGILVIPKVPGRLLDKLTLYKAQSNRQLLDQLPAVM